jgi:hypothetical protein
MIVLSWPLQIWPAVAEFIGSAEASLKAKATISNTLNERALSMGVLLQCRIGQRALAQAAEQEK